MVNDGCVATEAFGHDLDVDTVGDEEAGVGIGDNIEAVIAGDDVSHRPSFTRHRILDDFGANPTIINSAALRCTVRHRSFRGPSRGWVEYDRATHERDIGL